MNPARFRIIHDIVKPLQTVETRKYIIVSIEEQSLFVCLGGEIVDQYDCSTSRFGNGNRENSLKTPIGIHRIKEKYGAGAPAGRIFVDREDTGTDWDHKQHGDNLILSRIFRLEGLEQGINKGRGIDSYERYIYIHGSGREDLIGTPLSHGCVVMRNYDVIRLFDTIQEGAIVYIDPLPLLVNNRPCRNIHFTDIFDSGMSALAQYLRFQSIRVSGSDRFATSSDMAEIRKALETLSCTISPQDGSGITPDTDAVCISTAIEDTNPDMASARKHRIPIIHRSDLLAAVIATKKAIAVVGTRGKSTVTAMIFEFLTACGKSPSLISGAGLRRLEKQGMIGNAYSGGSDLLVVEADESDGTLAKYSPETSVILNMPKDHKTPEEIAALFSTLTKQSSWTVSNADDPVLAGLPASERFGMGGDSSSLPDRTELLSNSIKLIKKDVEYHLPFPGEHNLKNLAAALSVCEHYGCDPACLADAVRKYEGVARRFIVIKTTKRITLIDDIAHNPARIAADVKACRNISGRIIAVYQPHDFGPNRLLNDEYIETFRGSFREKDSLYLLPIYYAGGTAQKDLSSGDIIAGLGSAPFNAYAVQDREELLTKLQNDAKAGDCVLVMGACDPSLPALVNKIIELFGGAAIKVVISYSEEDKETASLIANRVRQAGHEVCYDPWSLIAGDNLIQKVNDGLKETDVLIVIVSRNALRSKGVMHEFSAIALGDLSNKKSRIIPVLIDDSSVPQYLARYVYVDLKSDFESGIVRIISALSVKPSVELIFKPEIKRTYDSAVTILSQALSAGRLTLVCGAGVSIRAGIPSWNQLLVRLLESMMKRISEDKSMALDSDAPDEFQRRYRPSALVVGKYLKSNLGNDFMPQLRDALYAKKPTSCELINAIVELARPQRNGKPLESIITFNFDGLIEEQLEQNNVRHRSISSEGVRNRPNELPIYHVHGFLPREGLIGEEVEVVFSEDAYHSQFIDSFSWSNLIQLNKLSQNTCLFVGLSLTDPNLRRLLDVSNRKNPSRTLNHFIIKQTPNASASDTIDQLAFLLEEQDANELGLNVIWVDEISDIGPFLKRIVASNS